MKDRADQTFTTAARSPSFGMVCLVDDRKFYPLFLEANGKAVISLSYHINAAAFAPEAQRQALVDRINAIPRLTVAPKTLTSDIRIPLEDLADDARLQAFLAIVGWTIDKFKEAAAG
jgi:hypothetical protein